MMIPHKVLRILKSGWIKKLLIFISFAGFTWQVTVVSVEYFAYKTTTAVSFKLLPHVKPQIAVLCFRYRDVMDRQKLGRQSGIRFATTANTEKQERDETLTIEQIFEYTPDVDQVIERCLVRDKDGTVSDELTDCKEYFSIEKYFKQEDICYQLRRKQKDDLLIEEVTHSTVKSFLVYEILLGKRFKEAAVVEAIIFQDTGGRYPYLSRDYAVKHWIKHRGRDSSTEQKYLYLSGSDIDIVRMPKPYDTQCVHVGDNVGYECSLACKLELYKEIGRVPVSELLFQPHRLKAVSEEDKRDPRLREKIRGIETVCREKCALYASWCNVHISITSFDASFHPNDSFKFSVNTAKQPDLYSRSLPITTFIEYFSFTAGCFGIWFGVSFLSLDPRRLVRHKKHKHRSHPKIKVPTYGGR